MSIVALVGLPAWALIDGYVRPPAAWPAAGYRRRTLAVISLGTPAGVGFVAAGIYFGRQRPRIVRASGQSTPAIPEPASQPSLGRPAARRAYPGSWAVP